MNTNTILHFCHDNFSFINVINQSINQLGLYVCMVISRWLKFEEDVEDGGERWSKPYVATLSLHSLFELRKSILNGTVLLDMRANSIEEITGKFSSIH